MISVSSVSFFLMFLVPLQESTVWAHIFLLAGSGLVMGTPYSRVCSGDPAEVCEGDQRKIHMAFFTVNLLRQLTQAGAYFCIGYFLQRSSYFLWLRCRFSANNQLHKLLICASGGSSEKVRLSPYFGIRINWSWRGGPLKEINIPLMEFHSNYLEECE